jgi:8-oxo-dGTP pyrophosphatase MutT (NUDIX family)
MAETILLPSGENVNNLRVINRVIVAAYIFSSDDKLLLGRKNPLKAGAYPDAWHIPGGGRESGESLADAMVREGGEEVIGLDLSRETLVELPFIAEGAAAKTLPNGEPVWCEMEFHHFEARLGQTALDLESVFSPGSDLERLQWFGMSELPLDNLIPGGRDLLALAGYIV